MDKAAGVVRGVLLCGAESKNGRSYPASLWPKSIGLYANVPIHADHGKERRVGDRIGWISNPRVVDARPRGDANFLTSHALVPPILEMAERNPSLCGFSHVCMADTRRVNGREVVESIAKVEAVDFVTDPATMAGLFESVQQGGRTVANKAAAVRVLEGLMNSAPARLRGSLRKVLVEQLDSKNYADAVGNAFLIAGHAVWTFALAGEITLADAIDKLRKLYQGHEAGGGSRADAGDVPAVESRSGVRWDAGAGRLVYEAGHPLAGGRAFAENLRGGSSDPTEHAKFVESVTGRRPKPSATWDGTRIRFTD